MAEQLTPPDLSPSVERGLDDFVAAARAALGDDLGSVVLYGSAAEGRLRATSDVNLLLVLAKFDAAKVDALREPLRFARAAIRLSVMFLLRAEIAPAMELFAVKFSDLLRRHRLLHGPDPFVDVVIPRAAAIARLKQVLLNMTLRLREVYAMQSLREEQLALALAESAGPLRVAAATLLELEGRPDVPPKEALGEVAKAIGGDWSQVLARISQAREERALPSGEGGPMILRMADLAAALRARVDSISR
jgi:predicted nucleotidyltransferase